MEIFWKTNDVGAIYSATVWMLNVLNAEIRVIGIVNSSANKGYESIA